MILTNPISAFRSLQPKRQSIGLIFTFLIFASTSVLAQEVCNNGVDDDNDGLIDLNDDDCLCEGFGGSSNLNSLIPNSSFEDMNCCPQGYSSAGSADYLNNCAQSWIQASNPTSDYWHMCGASGSSFDGLPPLPPPDGQGFVGFINMSGWQEYVGACLSQTMTAGDNYEFTFQFGHTNNSPPIDLTFYGSPNCGDLPFNGNDCPTGLGGFITLGSSVMGGGTGWVEQTVSFVPPIDINALVIGGACGSGGARTYYYLDDLTLNATDQWEVLSVAQSGIYCENNIVLTASSDTVGGTFQWYKEGIALVGQTTPIYNVPGGVTGVGNYTVTYSMNGQCEAENIEVIAVELPTADFVAQNVCFPAGIDFTDQSNVTTGAITNWDWDFGDATTSAAQNPSHNYITPGTYSVELIVTTDASCTDSYQTNITVYPKPTADFSSVAGCLGFQTTFTDQSIVAAPGNINQWEWDFGDLNTSIAQNPSNQYASINSYFVELITTTTDGCKDTVSSTIDVYPSPELDVSGPEECVLDDVQFVNNSTISAGTIVLYEWDFGDASTSNVAAPLHVYSDPNTYTVELVATSDEGCVADTIFQLISNPNPVADFTITQACLGDIVELTDNTSVQAPGILDVYSLNMGDLSPSLNSIPSSYQYGSSGSFDLELTITTTDGCDDTFQVSTDIYDVPSADFSFSNICEDDSVLFNDNSTIPVGTITSWNWDFGNGTTSTAEQPFYQSYPSDNTYPVSLIVYSGYGCSDTLEDLIEVYPVPFAEFTFDSVCFPEEIQFTDLSVDNGAYPISSWLWTFSDAQTSGIQSPSIDFGMAGTYSAELLISNGPGCKSTFVAGDAVVHALPEAEFPDDLAACLEEIIAFTDESVLIPVTDDVINSWFWNFDDTGASSEQFPSHLYQSANIYNVQFSVETNKGCSDVVTHPVEIYPLPNVDFTTTPREGCAPLDIQFIDQSSITPPYTLGSWNWYLGADPILSNAQNPFFTYDPAIDPLDVAVYDIGLTVTSFNGCVSAIYRPDFVTVYPKPNALFSVDDDIKDIINPTFQFTDLSSENVTVWDWDFGDASYSTIQHPEHSYPDVGTYPVVLMVETQYGCLDTIDYDVKVNPVFTFYIPNSFTPDDNGINDYFFGTGQDYSSYEMWVFDRWGEQLFYSADDQYHWDGTFKGEKVQQGTYIYRFYLLDWEGHDHKYSGHVTLHR